ncbi:DUF5592 family protein [Lactococcus lactis]|uniref:DUF5592 family protein n=1 Tax=Lactococcus lactis TaxID=1358 RepID=UPI0015C40BD8|nr:DUF5592 family protein [Lactococcus lactis]QLF91643.1 hypothetical protein HPC60_13620 [Lactococcus lactis subsp. lactis]
MYGVVKNIYDEIKLYGFIYLQDIAVLAVFVFIYQVYRKYFYFSIPLHIAFALFLLSMALFLVIRPLNNPQKRNYQLIFIMLSSFISRKIESI